MAASIAEDTSGLSLAFSGTATEDVGGVDATVTMELSAVARSVETDPGDRSLAVPSTT
jgi:hypothetical protein